MWYVNLYSSYLLVIKNTFRLYLRQVVLKIRAQKCKFADIYLPNGVWGHVAMRNKHWLFAQEHQGLNHQTHH